jgi:lipopolysaccharide export system permease protein
MLNFFPSRQLALYLAKMFLLRSFAVLLMLVLILQTLDLLSQSGKILAVESNGQAEILSYIGMRMPQLVARFLPYSVLLGALITFVGLSQNSEVISMKAAGMSAHQILAPMIAASLLMAATSFIFNDAIVAPTTTRLKQWQSVEYGKIPKDPEFKTNVWVREGQDLFHANVVTGSGPSTQLEGVTVYLRNAGGLRDVVSAKQAVAAAGGGWQLDNATMFNVAGLTQQSYSRLIVGKAILPNRFQVEKVDGDAKSFMGLRKSIAQYRASGKRTASLEGVYWHKLAGPLSSLLMPLLGAVAAFGLARSGALFVRAVIGMALGFAYFVVDNFALAMGNMGVYPPLVAAWAPFLLFLLIGETVLIRTEE